MWVIAFSHKNDGVSYWDRNFIEIIFISDLIVNFFIEYIPDKTGDGNKLPVRDLLQIATHYFKGNFLIDFIPILPFHLLDLPYNSSVLLYFVKMIRVKRAINLLNVHFIMKHVKKWF